MAVNVINVQVNSVGVAAAAKELEHVSRAGQQAETQTQRTARGMATMGQQAEKSATMLQKMSQSFYDLRNLAGGVFFTNLIAGAASDIIKMADAWQMMTAKLEIFVGTAYDAAKAQEMLFNMSQDLRVPLEATAQLYTRLVPAMQQYGKSAADAEAVTKSVAMALKLSGATGAETASVMLQFSQAMQAGRLNGAEFNAVAEGAPLILRALEQQTGKTRGELKKMGADGKLTLDLIVDSLKNVGDTWEKDFAKLPLTVDGAFTQLKNSFTKFFGELNKSAGITQSLADSISSFAKNLDTIAAVFTGVVVTAIGMYVSKLTIATATSAYAAIVERQRMVATLAAAKADEVAAVAALAKAKAVGMMGASGGVAAAQAKFAAATQATANAQAAANAQTASWMATISRFINPLTVAITTVGLLTAALYTNRDSVIEFGDTTATIGETARGIWKTISDVGISALSALGMETVSWQEVSTIAINAIKSGFYAVGKVLLFLGDTAAYTFVLMGKQLGNAAWIMVESLKNVGQTWTEIFEAIRNRDISGVMNAGAAGAKRYGDILAQGAKNAKDAFSDSWGAISRSVDGVVGKIEENIQAIQNQDKLEAQNAADQAKRSAMRSALLKQEADAMKKKTEADEKALKAAKRLHEQAEDLIATSEGFINKQEEELGLRRKLNEAEKQALQIENFILQNKAKLVAADRSALEAKQQEILANGVLITQMRELAESQMEMLKSRENAIELADKERANIAELQERNEAAKDELSIIPRLNSEIAKRAEYRAQETLRIREQTVAMDELLIMSLKRMNHEKGGYDEAIAKAEEYLAKHKEQLGATEQELALAKEASQLAKDKEMLDNAREYGKILTQSLRDSFENGKSFASNFWKRLKEIMLEKLVIQVEAELTGKALSAQSGSGGGAGLGGILSSLTNMISGGGGGGSAGVGGLIGGVMDKATGWIATQMAGDGLIGQGLNWISDTFGDAILKIGDTVSDVMGGFSGVLTFVSSLTQSYQNMTSRQKNQSAAMNIGSAAMTGGPWAAAAMAIIELSKIIAGKKGGPRQSGEAFMTTEGDAATGQFWKGLYGTITERTQYESQASEILKGIVGQYKELATGLGVVNANLKLGFGLETDPQGDAPSKIITQVADSLGNVLKRVEVEVDRDPAKFEAEIQAYASRLILEALKNSALPETMAKVFQGVDISSATAEQTATILNQLSAIKQINDIFKEIGKTMPTLANVSYAVQENLIALSGGFENFSKMLSSYYDNFYTEQEKSSQATNNLRKQFEALGLQMPEAGNNARAAFRSMVEGIDVSTEAGQKQYIGLLQLSSAFAELNPVVSAVEESVTEVTASLQQLVDAAVDTKQSLLSKYDPTGAANIGMSIVQGYFQNMNTEVGKLGMAIPTTTAMMSALVHSIDPSTEAGRKLAEELQFLAPHIDLIITETERQAQAMADAAAKERALIDEQRALREAAIAEAGKSQVEMLKVFNPEWWDMIQTEGLSKGLAEFNAQIPRNRDEMNGLLHSIDTTTEQGQKLAALLNEYSGYINSIVQHNAEIAAQRASLEEQFNILSGITTAREIEISKMDASVQELARRNDALQAEQAHLQEINQARASIQDKMFSAELDLLEVQGRSAEALAMRRQAELDALGAIDASLIPLQQAYYARLDEIEAIKLSQEAERTLAAERQRIVDERISLEQRLFQMTATTAEMRQAEINKLDVSNRYILERIYALEDERTAAEAAARAAEELAAAQQRIAQERYGLETQLLQLQGNTVELRRRELMLLDPSNQALQQLIWALQDSQEAASAAARAAEEYAEQRRREQEEISRLQDEWARNWFEFRDAIKDTIADLTNTVDPLAKRIKEIQDIQSRTGIEGPAQFGSGGAAWLLAQKDLAQIFKDLSMKSDVDLARERIAQMQNQLRQLGVVAPETSNELRNLSQTIADGTNLEFSIYGAQGQKALAILSAMTADFKLLEQTVATTIPPVEDLTEALRRNAELAKQYREYETKLIDLQGNATLALARRREDELAAADPVLHSIIRQIHAQEDLNAAYAENEEAAKRAAELQSQYRSYETQLMELQGRSAEVLARKRQDELAAADPLLRSIISLIHAQQDLNTQSEAAAAAQEQLNQAQAQAAEEARKLAELKSGLEIRLLEAQGNATEALARKRQDELAATDASLRSILLQIYAAEDASKIAAEAAAAQEQLNQAQAQAAEEARKLAEQRESLEIKLMRLQGRTAEALAIERQRELAAADGSLHGLMRQIWALEDLEAAANGGSSSIKQLEDLIKQRQDVLREAYGRESKVFEEAVSKFRNFGKALRDFRDSLNVGPEAMLSPEAQYQATRAEFERLGALALSGDEVALGRLQDTSKAYLDASKEYYASSASYFEDLDRVKTLIEQASVSAEAAADVQQLQLNAMTNQVGQLIDLNTNVVTVAQAIQALQATQQQASDQQASNAEILAELQQANQDAQDLRRQLQQSSTLNANLLQQVASLTQQLIDLQRLANSRPA